jgi:hypothetical protein
MSARGAISRGRIPEMFAPMAAHGALTPMNPAVLDALFWAAVGVCAVAQGFILRAAFAPEAPAPAGSPAEAGRAAGRLRRPSRPLEIGWAVLPAIALVLLFLWAWQLQHPSAASPVIRTIEVPR